MSETRIALSDSQEQKSDYSERALAVSQKSCMSLREQYEIGVADKPTLLYLIPKPLSRLVLNQACDYILLASKTPFESPSSRLMPLAQGLEFEPESPPSSATPYPC
jgi:hypothetical protein